MAGAIASAPSAVHNGAWWTLACNMSIMLIAGTIYGFGAWSPALKQAYNLGQERIDLLAVAGHIGNYIVLDSGMLTARFGTVFGMALGCAYACVGYLTLWLSIAVFPGQFPMAVLVAACVIYGHGCGTIDNAVMTQALADFRDYKGNVNGCIKAYYGLATATVAMIYEAVFRPDKAAFLLFLAIYAAVAGSLLVPVVNRTKGLVEESSRVVRKKFRMLAVGLFFFAVYFFAMQLHRDAISRPWWRMILVTVALGMASLFALPFTPKKRRKNVPGAECPSACGAPVGAESPESAEPPIGGRAGGRVRTEVSCAPLRDVTGLQMVLHLDFWLFMAICVVGQGCGLMFIGNAAQILPAVTGYAVPHAQTAFVAAISIFNSLARLTFGMGSEVLRGRVARSWFLVAAMACLLSGYTLLWLFGLPMLWPAAFFVGFGYGGLWGVQPPMVGELFGPSDFSFKYSCSTFAAAVGSILFNEVISGPIYQTNAEGRPEYPFCYDSGCFNESFAIAAVLCVPAIAIAVALALKTRWLYSEAPGVTLNAESSGDES